MDFWVCSGSPSRHSHSVCLALPAITRSVRVSWISHTHRQDQTAALLSPSSTTRLLSQTWTTLVSNRRQQGRLSGQQRGADYRSDGAGAHYLDVLARLHRGGGLGNIDQAVRPGQRAE